jgi:hypothetical protein
VIIAAPQPALHDCGLVLEFAELVVLDAPAELDKPSAPPPDPQAVSTIAASRHNA